MYIYFDRNKYILKFPFSIKYQDAVEASQINMITI